MKRESDRKCVIHARVHASAQSFDRCGDADYSVPSLLVGRVKADDYDMT